MCDTDVPGEDLRRLVRTVSETVYLIAEGQQMDIDFEARQTVGVDEYILMVEEKTAVLFACAAEGGAIIAGGTDQQVRDMKECARLWGIGFQIWDDVLGILGDEKKTGKPVGNDIRNGKRTLIIVHALEQLKRPCSDRDVLLNALGKEHASAEEVSEAIAVLERTGSIDFVTGQAHEYARKAKELLQCLAPSEEKRMISSLIDYAVITGRICPTRSIGTRRYRPRPGDGASSPSPDACPDRSAPGR
jgi:geranylgeranyl diphosphate synthase type I